MSSFVARVVSFSRLGAIELGQRDAQLKIEALEAEVERLREKLRVDKATRIYWNRNAQIVEVDGFAYRWVNKTPLKLGDRVWLPESFTSRQQRGPGPFPGTVTGIGSTQRGELPLIVRRDTRSDESAKRSSGP